MNICVCGPSALELYRSHGRLAPELLEGKRSHLLTGCGIPEPLVLDDELSRLGVSTRPYHLMTPNHANPRWLRKEAQAIAAAKAAGSRGIPDKTAVRHAYEGSLPRRSLLRVSRSVLVTMPELVLLELAAPNRGNATCPGELNDSELALIALELCGGYLLDCDDESWTGFTNISAPLTSIAKVSNVVNHMPGAHGVPRLKRVLDWVADSSNSPMESILYLLMTLPSRMGGAGLGKAQLNYRVDTPEGSRWIDVAFVEARVGLEYKGRDAHSVERSGRDDRRQNKIVGSGWIILNVWYEDIADPNLYQQLVHDVACAMGRRFRPRAKGYETRRNLLRASLIPQFKRYGSVVA